MKASDLKLLILQELIDFNEFRPSKDSWCSVMSVLKKLQVDDINFSRSVMQSLIEDNLILHRGGEKLQDGQFELIIQINNKGIEFFNTENQKLSKQNPVENVSNDKPPNTTERHNNNNASQRPIGLIWITVIGGTLVLMIGYIFRHYLGIPL